ncbi:MAG: hypothetical protein PHW93_07335 [Candidatus Methanomethylophilaceae archaeon]|nr:hypothetical protein [Candidatus Methanomethylophilaceae archaeon]
MGLDFWNKDIETMSRVDIEALQLKHLKALVSRLYDSSPLYHGRMRQQGVRPEDIQTVDDIRKLPFTKKSDLRDNYPDKLFVVPQSEISRYHVSSGTTGKPTVVGYTRRDLDNWAESLARSFRSFGMGDEDVLQVSNGYGLFSGGLGMHYGAEKLGAAVLPAGTGNTNRQVDLMLDLPVTAIACTPSYMIHIAEVADKRGINLHMTLIFATESWGRNHGRRACAVISKTAPASRPRTATGPASFPVLCSRNAASSKASMSGETSVSSRYWTKRAVSRWPKERRARWWSPCCRGKPCP